MKKFGLIILFIGITLCAFQAQNIDLASLAEAEGKAYAPLVQFTSHGLADGYDVKYHRFEWEIDPAIRYIKGSVTTYFQSVTDGLNELYFDMAESLNVDSVIFRNQHVLYQKLPDDLLLVDLPVIIPDFDIDSVTIYYQGEPGFTGFGSFVQTTHGPDQTPIVWTLSEPYGARDWRPCKQDLADKADSIDVYITTPSAYRAASNGVLVSETTNAALTTYHWKHGFPIPAYLIGIAVTNYAVYSDFVPVDGGNPIEVLNYVYPEHFAIMQTQSPAIIPFIQLFNDLVGLYPYASEKYGHAQFGWGGGIEHTTMSFMYSFDQGLMAHEVAHQWFGDKVTCGSWKDIWLNEGFATYLEGLTVENGLRQASWKDWLRGKIAAITSDPGGSVYVNDTTSTSRIFNGRLTYSKAAMVLHMLRWRLGDADFFQALRNYLDDPELAFGFAKTPDLQRHLEQQSGIDLDEFFADWIYGEGFPVYTVAWWQDGNGELSIRLEQTTSHPSVAFYEMPVPLGLRNSNGDIAPVVLDHTFSGQTYQLTPGFEVAEIIFDPDIWLVALVDAITGTREQKEISDAISIYPNPVGEHLIISLNNEKYQIDAVELYDTAGRKIRRHSAKAGKKIRIATEDLLPGFYQLKIFVEDFEVGKSFIKH